MSELEQEVPRRKRRFSEEFKREVVRLVVEELADRTGLEVGRVTAIALGRWTPSPTERQKIAAVFGVASDEISWGHATPIQHLYGHGLGG